MRVFERVSGDGMSDTFSEGGLQAYVLDDTAANLSDTSKEGEKTPALRTILTGKNLLIAGLLAAAIIALFLYYRKKMEAEGEI